MKIRTALVLTLWLCPLAWAAEKAEDSATKSAESWLSLVDQGRYGESWDADGTWKIAERNLNEHSLPA
jgi:hypothetical protein